MATRDHLVLFINGKRHAVRGADAFLSLSDYLRLSCAMVGTKIVCSEGDCGSCTVLIGRPDGEQFEYRPIDSCIRFMYQLDGVHVVSVEGLARDGQLTPVQQAMVDCHGSQCGFCTPGFVMAMTGVIQDQDHKCADESHWRTSLTGNLCRCTGYTPIFKACLQAAGQDNVQLSQQYPAAPMLRDLKPLAADTIELRGATDGKQRLAYCPTTLIDALAFRSKHPGAKVVAGATDVGVQCNKRVIEPEIVLDLNRVSELQGARVKEDNGSRSLIAGARTTWTELLDLTRALVPELAAIIAVFGSPQIRHAGTLGGNIINASPIADSIPFLFVMEAELELASTRGTRRVNINDFYQGYKKFDLRPDELLAAVHIPLPRSADVLRLFKVSRRRDLDISTFTAAVKLRLDGDVISDAAIAYGAVGPTVSRLRRTEHYLRGRTFSEATMRAAGDLAVEEITPISDVRGSSDYRYQLARNVLLKLYHEQQQAVEI